MRQKLRRGSRTCTSEERKLLRRRGDLSARKRTRSPSSAPSSASSAQRSPNKSRTKKPKYGKRIRKHKSRNEPKKKLRKRGRPRTRFSSAKIKPETTRACVDSEKQDETDRVARDPKGGPSTPLGSERDTSKSIENEKLSDPSIDESNGSEEISGAREN
ncbi:serine/Arginine-related protein 53-like [Athalia rosae]|uniref:serine/Arginine-related protein 53-like n=1 Tax=Athalia rosae TaxID=37344 RepID=UPI0020340EB1|nr:serine/Arginine-related protein 53-like [Athalia rosae]